MKKIYLYESFTSYKDIFIGTIFIDFIHNKEVYSFQFDDEYLKNPSIKVNFDNLISLYKGQQYANDDTFSFLKDMMPDRWGRLLVKHKKKENGDFSILNDSDYLLLVNDATRMGGFRLSLDKKTFIADENKDSVPLYIYLRKLEEAAINFSKNQEVQKWINELFYAGSSLGGARPKANIYDNFNNLYIAKFPNGNDEYDIEAFEAVCYELAKLLNINVPDFKVEKLSSYGSTLLSKRFDRDKDKRIHYVTGLTLLNKKDGEQGFYLDIVSAIESYSKNVKSELKELFKRAIFNIVINNTDNHLRNIAFILEGNYYKLSPLYDVNPNRFKSSFATSFTSNGHDQLIDAINNAKYFKLNESEAKSIIDKTIKTIKNNYFDLCKKYHINNKISEEMFASFNLFF